MVRVVKNKVAAPFKAVNLDILFGTGIDASGCTLDAAEELGIVERKGSWYSYNGENLAQGRLKVVELMKKDEKFSLEIEQKVREALDAMGKEKVETLPESENDELMGEDEEGDNEMEDATKLEKETETAAKSLTGDFE